MRIARPIGHAHYFAGRFIGPNKVGDFDAVEEDVEA